MLHNRIAHRPTVVARDEMTWLPLDDCGDVRFALVVGFCADGVRCVMLMSLSAMCERAWVRCGWLLGLET